MLDTICTIPLPSDLFTLALHPTQPILTVGLASGHVHTYRLPSLTEEESDTSPDPPTTNGHPNGSPASIISKQRRASSASENGLGSIDLMWETRRHKGSCRCLTYSHDGSICYSAGTDGVVKAFEFDTGKVTSKIVLPRSEYRKLDAPTMVYALSPKTLLVGLDSGRVVLFDLKENGRVFVQDGKEKTAWTPHGSEPVNAIVPLPVGEESTSGFPKQWISVGGQTLAVTNVRKGVVATSEDQEVELTSVVMVKGLKKGGTSVGEKIVVGQADGILSLWERGVWGDLDERITIDRGGASIDAMIEVPEALGQRAGSLKMNEKVLALGLDDGRVRLVRIGRNAALSEWDVKHDDTDGVIALGFDVEGRMVSGGGQVVKVWTDAPGTYEANGPWKRQFDFPEDYDYEYEEERDIEYERVSEDSEEEQSRGPRKKRKRNKGKDKTGGRDIDFRF